MKAGENREGSHDRQKSFSQISHGKMSVTLLVIVQALTMKPYYQPHRTVYFMTLLKQYAQTCSS